MVKKKPFIDKKNASTYHIVRRSQRDVGGYYDDSTGELNDLPSDFLLMPTPETVKKQQQENNTIQQDGNREEEEKKPTVLLNKMKSKLDQAGLLDEDYNYDRHMKPITGSGVYFSGDSGKLDTRAALGDARASTVPLNDEIRELDRNLDSIALSQDCMDSDMAQALFGDFDEGSFEEILDDFCITADEEPQHDDNESGDGDDNNGFDFDAHIQDLLNKASKQEGGGSMKTNRQSNDDFFSGQKALHKHGHGKLHDLVEEDEEEDSLNREFNNVEDTAGVVPKLCPDEERALVEKFEMALAEYDSDELGDLDNECQEIGGVRPLEGDKQLEAVFDDFLTEKRDEIFIEGTSHLPENKRVGGSGFAALVGKRMIPSKGLKNTEDQDEEDKIEVEKFQDVLAEADQILANPEMDLPPEEVFIDGKSYFTQRTVNPWDCESILSTYSNCDNNPAVIGRNRKKKSSKPKETGVEGIPEDQPAQIRLSNKTGLPINTMPTAYTDDDTLASVNRGQARRRGESKEEKKARKQGVKQEKLIAKFQKKIMKEAFAEEFDRRSTSVLGNDVGGKSVFRYS
uniref:Protein LTV1 homolog n=1 Tax=Eucampia antarctica TaxID=49252 RepID=A0A7S2R514_9STRA|mmetsp:Transcript_16781/g.16212  ORF Transcript_16781/g.16212 Transcript_16781/m.16212 type:complete len:570 (+) Transcript_16781:63-1772(+)